ncbi:MAG: DUF4214 domain-containing protein [Acidimicrobiales bacterium]
MGRSITVVIVALAAALSSAIPAAAVDPDGFVRPEEGQVERLYRSILGREAEAGGFAFWVARLTTVETLDELAAHFVASPEFADLAGAPTDGEFIDLLYDHVLGRAPDLGGRTFWLAQLADGMPRTRVAVLFSESPEFVTATDTGLPELPAFAWSAHDVTAAELGPSWRPGCPVGPESLVRLRLRHVTYPGDVELGAGWADGDLVVHRDVAEEVTRIFERLYAARFPIHSMRPVDEFDASDDASMEADNTSAFNCRPVTGGSGWSNHAYGRAIDINPLINPYLRGETVLPPAGVDWIDRTRHHPGIIRSGDVVTDAFALEGWRWGGDWRSLKDWQHFDRAG